MKKVKQGLCALALAVMFTGVTVFAQTTSKNAKQEQGSKSTMTVKCIKGGCCAGKMLCCGDKASTLQKSLESVKGVSKVEVNKKTAEAIVEYNGEVKESDLNTAAKKAGFEVAEVTSKK